MMIYKEYLKSYLSDDSFFDFFILHIFIAQKKPSKGDYFMKTKISKIFNSLLIQCIFFAILMTVELILILVFFNPDSTLYRNVLTVSSVSLMACYCTIMHNLFQS